jgi:enamine deaminase RidA (YjgF/YER057c/UK114 family)
LNEQEIRIETHLGSPATGTYSQAVRTGNLVFVTGQPGRDPKTGKFESGLEAQTRRVLRTSTLFRPARTAFQAAALPAGALVMVDVVAAWPL